MGVIIKEVGKALPRRVVHNTELEKLIDTNNEWIIERTGIEERRVAEEEKGLDLAAAAAREALGNEDYDTIDLLMTDVVMPEMNGRDLAEKISETYPDITLLFMSGYTANVIAHQGVLDDGVAFIQKPFSMGDLIKKVREVLDGAKNLTQR